MRWRVPKKCHTTNKGLPSAIDHNELYPLPFYLDFIHELTAWTQKNKTSEDAGLKHLLVASGQLS